MSNSVRDILLCSLPSFLVVWFDFRSFTNQNQKKLQLFSQNFSNFLLEQKVPKKSDGPASEQRQMNGDTKEENEDSGDLFFALPTGIAELDDSEQSLCASGADFGVAEEEDEAFLSSGEDTPDFSSFFAPPSRKYEALRSQQGAPIQNLWSFGSFDTTAEYVSLIIQRKHLLFLTLFFYLYKK